MQFLRTRARLEVSKDEVEALIRQLGDPKPEVSGKAEAELIARGTLVIPMLRRAVNDLEDPNRGNRAKNCLAQIEGKAAGIVPISAIRLLAKHKAKDAVDVFILYLPYAEDGGVTEALHEALAELAYVDGKPHPSLIKALGADLAVHRAAAVDALCRPEHPEILPKIVKLLQDPKGMVQLRVAVALVGVDDPSAVPVLIDLMGQLPTVDRMPAEAALRELAVASPPSVDIKDDSLESRKKLRDAWRAWWDKTDGAALLKEFTSRSATEADREKIASLIIKLGDANFRIRKPATQDLITLGTKAIPQLQRAINDPDPERQMRVEESLQEIRKADNKRVPLGAARLLALRRPAGAAQAMLDQLPYTDDDDSLVEEIRSALKMLALDANGTPEPVILKALESPFPIERIVAAEVLSRVGKADARDAVRKLLTDKDLSVRQRVAVALASSGEKPAVEVLIRLIAEMPVDQAGPTLEVLFALAEGSPPAESMSLTPDSRAKVRDGWLKWWREHAQDADLAKLASGPKTLGYTVLCNTGPSNHKVVVLGFDGKPRATITDVKYPVDAWALPGGRVLIAEWSGNRFIEKDFNDKLLWEYKEINGQPVNVQRLPNGNTFLVTDREIKEITRAGTTVYKFNPAAGITAAYRMTNGQIAALLNDGTCARLDTTGKVLKSFPSKRDTSWTSGIDLMSNGNILITQPSLNKITEMTMEGKEVWSLDVAGVITATRTSNNTFVVATSGNESVREIDRFGKVLWVNKEAGSYHRARRR